MPAQEPILDFILLDTHSLSSIAVVDVSKYPTGFTKTNPSLQITAPGYDSVVLSFTPGSVQVYKSSNLGIVCEWCDETELPDGIWTFKYSLYPSTKYYVERTFVKIDRLQKKYDEVYLQLDLTECDEKIKQTDKDMLSLVEDYIEGAVAAGNKCANALFLKFYNKATETLNKYINGRSCATR